MCQRAGMVPEKLMFFLKEIYAKNIFIFEAFPPFIFIKFIKISVKFLRLEMFPKFSELYNIYLDIESSGLLKGIPYTVDSAYLIVV